MSAPRTPEQMAHEINDLNCHVLPKSPVVKDGKTYDPSEVGYGPVTEKQMQAIYAEAMTKAAELASEMADTYTANGNHDCAAGAHAAEALIRSYVDTLRKPEEKK